MSVTFGDLPMPDLDDSKMLPPPSSNSPCSSPTTSATSSSSPKASSSEEDLRFPTSETGVTEDASAGFRPPSIFGIGGDLGGGGACDPCNPRYKTEMCRNFKERAKCIYGDSCQFAHGKRELREVVRNNKYKTKLCQKYWISGYCVYGPRCNFLHDEIKQHQYHK